MECLTEAGIPTSNMIKYDFAEKVIHIKCLEIIARMDDWYPMTEKRKLHKFSPKESSMINIYSNSILNISHQQYTLE